MENLDWLADLAGDCLAFGEKHGLKHVELGAQAIGDALEKDLGLHFKLPLKPNSCLIRDVCVSSANTSNVLLFPMRGVKLEALSQLNHADQISSRDRGHSTRF